MSVVGHLQCKKSGIPVSHAGGRTCCDVTDLLNWCNPLHNCRLNAKPVSTQLNRMYHLILCEIIYEENLICGLQRPRKLLRSSRLLQLAGRWQYDGVMWLELRSKDLMSTFLIRSATSQWIVLTRLGAPRNRPNPHWKLWKRPEIEPLLSWSVLRHSDP